MTGKIFISYRREDKQAFARRLYERLAKSFGKEELFFDVDSIPPGFDFVAYIENQIALSDIVLVVIGGSWLNLTDQEGRRRLDSPEDFVRVEIESALKQGKHVVPLLVEGASMPRSKDMPRKMQPLARRNAFFAVHGGTESEFEKLVLALQNALLELGRSREAARQEALEGEKRRQAELADAALRGAREAAERDRLRREEDEGAEAEARVARQRREASEREVSEVGERERLKRDEEGRAEAEARAPRQLHEANEQERLKREAESAEQARGEERRRNEEGKREVERPEAMERAERQRPGREETIHRKAALQADQDSMPPGSENLTSKAEVMPTHTTKPIPTAGDTPAATERRQLSSRRDVGRWPTRDGSEEERVAVSGEATAQSFTQSTNLPVNRNERIAAVNAYATRPQSVVTGANKLRRNLVRAFLGGATIVGVVLAWGYWSGFWSDPARSHVADPDLSDSDPLNILGMELGDVSVDLIKKYKLAGLAPFVYSVVPGSPADNAGIDKYTFLYAVGSKYPTNKTEAFILINRHIDAGEFEVDAVIKYLEGTKVVRLKLR